MTQTRYQARTLLPDGTWKPVGPKFRTMTAAVLYAVKHLKDYMVEPVLADEDEEETDKAI